MRSKARRILVLAVLAAAVVGLQGCGFVNKLRAKNELNEGVRTFNKGKYEDAEKIFQQALDYDPDNVNAQFFHAMALNALFEKSLNSQEVDKSGSIDLGKKTIDAFQKVFDETQELKFQDRAISFIAKAYKSFRDQVYNPKTEKAQYDDARAKYLSYLEKRADLPNQTDTVKAQMYYTIGDDYWREGREIIEAHAKRDPANPLAVPTAYDVPAELVPQINAALTKAHEYMEKAVAKDPAYPEPYLGEKLTYMEDIKLISDTAKKSEVDAKIKQWDEKYREKLSDKQAAEAANPPAEGAGAGQ
jgi:tetratricopeptide (TPR) repeat protein